GRALKRGGRLAAALPLRRRATPCVATAAVAGEELDQAVHRLEVGAVGDAPALRLAADQAGLAELLQVEGKGGAGQGQGGGDVAGAASVRPGLDQQPEDGQ